MRRYCFRLAFLAVACGIYGCASVRLTEAVSTAPPSEALAEAKSGLLATYASRTAALLEEGESAYWVLDRGDAALTARLALTDHAVSSLDLQYFIWQPDESGWLLIERVIEAADRGVRVRLLLDDFAANGLDEELAGLDAHPSIEVRVFNPWFHRRWRLIKAAEFLARVNTLNHRMHNKVYLADNQFGIIGGRNIGNRYFGLHEEFVQNDLDLMVSGPLTRDLSESFDLFWNSPLAYPAAALPGRRDDPDQLLVNLRARIEANTAQRARLLQYFPLQPADWTPYFEQLYRSMTAGPGHLYYDLPSIHSDEREQLPAELWRLISDAEEEVLISSPYFIPDREFVEGLRGLVESGVRVAVLTNSLASNNHAVAHTGYKRWRRAVIEAGVELYEFRADAAVRSAYSTPPVEVQSLGLHGKAVVVDGRQVFIGSPNIDPRSLRLNTEIGIIAEDEELAERVVELLSRDMSGANSWRVTLRDERWLLWTSDEGTRRRQPADGFRQRSTEFFLNLLPLKGQL